MTTYLIVSGATLLGALIVVALIYLLVLSSELKRSCKDLRESFEAHRAGYETKVANIYRDIDVKEAALMKSLEELSRDHENAVTAIYQEIEAKLQTLVNQHEKARSDLDRRIDDAGSYTDSRFDQLLNKVEKEYVQKGQTLMGTNK
jgi:phosphoglycerate-specific signal transduction histidine kinase